MVLIFDDLLTPFVLVIPKAVKQSIPLELLWTSYNDMGHTVCRNNPYQPHLMSGCIFGMRSTALGSSPLLSTHGPHRQHRHMISPFDSVIVILFAERWIPILSSINVTSI